MGLSASARDLVIRTLIGEAARDDPRQHGLGRPCAQEPRRFRPLRRPVQRRPLQYDQGAEAVLDAERRHRQFRRDDLAQRPAAISAPARSPTRCSAARSPTTPVGPTIITRRAACRAGGRRLGDRVRRRATIGGQHFYKLGLSASDATSQGTPPLGRSGRNRGSGRSSIGRTARRREACGVERDSSAPRDAKSMLGKNEVPDHDEIMKYLHDGGQDLDPHKLAWCASFVSAIAAEGRPVPTQVAAGSLQAAARTRATI